MPAIGGSTTSEAFPPGFHVLPGYLDAYLGLHQDRGDSSLAAPVVSISLGDDATTALADAGIAPHGRINLTLRRIANDG
jgi:hypothetical protein